MQTHAGTAVAKKAPEVIMPRRSTTKRDLVKGSRKFYAKRDANGRFRAMDRMDRSLAADRPKKAKRTVKAGHGDQGDRKRRAGRKR